MIPLQENKSTMPDKMRQSLRFNAHQLKAIICSDNVNSFVPKVIYLLLTFN